MTFTPSHISLESILLWSFIPTSEKERFQQKKHYFWIVIAFSLLPDLDVFVGLHRGLSHSVIFPLILVISGGMIYYYYQHGIHILSNGQKKEEKLVKRSFIGRCVLYSGILWLIHIILDLEQPLTIFYPLSDRLYQFNFEILFDVMPWLIFPATIVGIGFEISGLSYLRGLRSYFVNLPPSIREEIYGHTPVAFSIDDFFVHVILFAIFLVYVALPMTPTVNLGRFSDWRKKLNFDGPILGLGVILLVMGFVIGPMIGTHTIDSDSIKGSFQASTTVFSPSLAISFETTKYLLQPDTVFFIEGTLKTTSNDDPFDQMLLLTTKECYNNFSSRISKLFKQSSLNSTDTVLEFVEEYQSILSDLITYPLAMNLTNHNETSLRTQKLGGSFALVGVIEAWNSTQILNNSRLYENVQLEVVVTSSRFTLLVFGLASMISGIVLLIFSVRVKKRK